MYIYMILIFVLLLIFIFLGLFTRKMAFKMLYARKFGIQDVLNDPKLKEKWGIEKSSPADFGLDYEDVEFKSYQEEAPLLKGWWIKRDSNKCIVLVHGRWSNRLRTLRMLEFLKELPHSILLFDVSANGDSGGDKFTMGYHEKYDLAAAVDFVKERIPFKELVLYGFSAGTLVTSLYAAENQNQVSKLILDSAFYSAKDIILEVASKRNYPKLFISLGFKLYEKIGKLKLSELNIAQKAPLLKNIPTLILHSKEDEMVHFMNAKVLYSAFKENAEFELFEKGSHVNIYPANKEKYAKKVLDFLRK